MPFDNTAFILVFKLIIWHLVTNWLIYTFYIVFCSRGKNCCCIFAVINTRFTYSVVDVFLFNNKLLKL